MDKHIIKMPDIGEGIAEVEIVQWHVAVGDEVVEDQVLADVMTDKASVEIPSPIAGSIVSLGGEVGDILAVGSELITLKPHAEHADVSPDRTTSEVQAVAGAMSAPATAVRQDDAQADAAQTVAKPSTSYVTSGRVIRSEGKTVLASPSVRQRARHLEIDLQEFGQGRGETPVSHRDLDEYLLSRYEYGKAASRPKARQADLSADESGTSAGFDDSTFNTTTRGDTQIRVMGLRRQIALKMQESKRQIPHFSYVEEVDVTELETLRSTLNEQSDDSGRLTLLPFLVRAMVLAIERFPQVNAHYDSENAMITQCGAVHMGIATQTDNGLMVPVLRNAQSCDIWDCGAEIRRLSSAARRGKARRDELSGSTITLSSLGSLGGIAATPIINHPEVAIVGVNRIVEKPVLAGGQLVVRKTMNLSSSFDHRIVDGMHAAQFIQEVRRLLESPVLLFVRTRA